MDFSVGYVEVLTRELLSVAKFDDFDPTKENECAMCLFEFFEKEEIQCMRNSNKVREKTLQQEKESSLIFWHVDVL
ncbi:E3 ubiquitin-protein ligase RHA1B [Spatholobus suberectus]|nr:E3 ubiquitin-protein ligase RHA1B [Spatholobus suberectus]